MSENNEKLARVLRVLKQEDIDLKVQALEQLAYPYFADDDTVIAAVTAVLLRERGDFRAYKARMAAARALAAIGGQKAIQALTYALEDDHRDVQIVVVDALAQLGDAAMQPQFVALFNDDSPPVRVAALEAITRITLPDTRPYPAIITALADREDAVREVAQRILQEAGNVAVPALIDALADTDSTIRGAAADLLGASGDERARNPLRKIASDDASSWVKSRAEQALDALPKEQFVQPRVKRSPPGHDKLEAMRADEPNWSRHGAAGNMTIEQVQAMLDSLDLRLMNGEISESLYQTLLTRWQARLEAIKRRD